MVTYELSTVRVTDRRDRYTLQAALLDIQIAAHLGVSPQAVQTMKLEDCAEYLAAAAMVSPTEPEPAPEPRIERWAVVVAVVCIVTILAVGCVAATVLGGAG